MNFIPYSSTFKKKTNPEKQKNMTQKSSPQSKKKMSGWVREAFVWQGVSGLYKTEVCEGRTKRIKVVFGYDGGVIKRLGIVVLFSWWIYGFRE